MIIPRQPHPLLSLGSSMLRYQLYLFFQHASPEFDRTWVKTSLAWTPFGNFEIYSKYMCQVTANSARREVLFLWITRIETCRLQKTDWNYRHGYSRAYPARHPSPSCLVIEQTKERRSRVERADSARQPNSLMWWGASLVSGGLTRELSPSWVECSGRQYWASEVHCITC